MTLIRRHLFRTIVSMTALVLAVLLSLAGFIEFVGQLDDVGTGTYAVPQALAYALMKLPALAAVMLPMATLLGALLGLGALASNSEIIVLRAAGVSTARLAAAVAVTGVAVGLATLLLSEYVGPELERYARQYRTIAKHGQAGIAAGGGVWIRDGQTLIHLSGQDEDFRYGGIYMYELADPGRLAAMARADSAEIDASDQWVLNNLASSRFGGGGVEVTRSPRAVQQRALSADLLALTVVRPDNLNGAALLRYVRYLRGNGLDAQAYEVAFWSRAAAAVAVVPMCLLALPFAFGSLRSSGAGARMVVGVIIGVAYFLAARGLADGGAVYGLDPVLVAWLPTLVLAGVTAFMVGRTR